MPRVAVVTGGNKGIGFAIVKALCGQFVGVIYLTARSEKRGLAAVNELKTLGLQPVFHQLDINDESSVDKFAMYLKDTYGGVDLIVNNAAIAFPPNSTEPLAYQAAETIKVNYFGLLRVSKALFPLLKSHGRVVQVSSSVGHLSNVPGRELKAKLSSPDLTEEQLSQLMTDFVDAVETGDHEAAGWPKDPYYVSKVGVCALTGIQQRSFDKDTRIDLVVNSVHPGNVDTDMTSHKGHVTPERGAQAPLFAAMLPINTSIRGKYIWHDNSLVDCVTGRLPAPY